MIIPSTYALLYLLAFHWFADFVMQTDWQAKNKADNVLALLEHVLLYTMIMAVGSIFITDIKNPISVVGWVAFVFSNGAFHFGTDFVTSKVSKHYWLANKRHEFFVVVGFDQLIHQVTLALTMMRIFYGGL